jgi:hypothetical protein
MVFMPQIDDEQADAIVVTPREVAEATGLNLHNVRRLFDSWFCKRTLAGTALLTVGHIRRLFRDYAITDDAALLAQFRRWELADTAIL